MYNLEPKIVNTALMQVSQYHKEKGDTVEMYSPLYHSTYDKVYAFSLFDFTPKHYVRDDMICGGTGFDITRRLPEEIEKCDYDWSVYPDCDYSIVWFSRGCIRNCPFCVVRQKEGYIHPVEPKNLNPNGQWIRVQDNNFFANPKWREAIDKLVKWDQPVDLQGIDVRIFDREQGEALQKLRFKYPIKIGWDNPKENIDEKVELLLEYVKPSNITCYILIGFDTKEKDDLYRIYHIWDNYKILPYVMPYNRKSAYQRGIARWCNNRFVFKSVRWEVYKNAPYPVAIDYLLKSESFDKDIWECACGSGKLSERLKEKGHNVLSTDLIYRGYGEKESIDFLRVTDGFDGDIITNPPYNLALEFVQKALELSNRKVAMFLRIQFLESKKRYLELFTVNPPKKVLVFVKRMKCYANDDITLKGSSAICFCWIIWDKEYKGNTILEWIDNL